MVEVNQAKHLKSYKIDFGVKTLNLSQRTHIMGVLNVTPDSFYDGGKYFNLNQALQRATQMVEQGADIIDVGGESTRPGADCIPVREESNRVLPVIEKLRDLVDCPISIDTRKAEIARRAVEAGANLINDVSGLLFDPDMVEVAIEYNVPVVIMHMRGTPGNMQTLTDYHDLISDICSELEQAVQAALEKGMKKHNIIIDPGIGFSKKREDNFKILKMLKKFDQIGCPLLVGVSNKSFIGWKLNLPEGERMWGTAAAVAASILQGAHIVRVHDVKEMVQVARIIDQIKYSKSDTVAACV